MNTVFVEDCVVDGRRRIKYGHEQNTWRFGHEPLALMFFIKSWCEENLLRGSVEIEPSLSGFRVAVFCEDDAVALMVRIRFG